MKVLQETPARRPRAQTGGGTRSRDGVMRRAWACHSGQEGGGRKEEREGGSRGPSACTDSERLYLPASPTPGAEQCRVALVKLQYLSYSRVGLLVDDAL